MLEVFLLGRSKFVLGASRPTMEIIHVLELKGRRGFIFRRGQRRNAAQNEQQNKNSLTSHSHRFRRSLLGSSTSRLRLPQPQRVDHRLVDLARGVQPMIVLKTAERSLGSRAESSVDRAIVISLVCERALDIADLRIGLVLLLMLLSLFHRRSILVGGIGAVVIIARVIVVVGIQAIAITVGIERERIVNEPEAVPEMATVPVPGMIAAPVPVPMPVRGMTRHDPAPVESLGTSTLSPVCRGEPRVRPRNVAGIKRGRSVAGITGSIQISRIPQRCGG